MPKERDRMPVEEIAQWVDYNPKTGCFTWKDNEHWRPNIRSRYVGKPAGTATIGNRNNTAYLYITIKRTKYLAHRVAWALQTGEWPEHQVDHEDKNGLNNRWSNLRHATNQENHKNAPMQCNNTSGVTGISFNKATGKWYAYITVDGRMRSLGLHQRKRDAIAVRKEAEQAHGFHPSHGT